jgi:hypothetical protein
MSEQLMARLMELLLVVIVDSYLHHLQKFLFVELLFEFGPAPLINVISRVYNGCTKLVSNSSIHCVTALVLSFVVLAI